MRSRGVKLPAVEGGEECSGEPMEAKGLGFRVEGLGFRA